MKNFHKRLAYLLEQSRIEPKDFAKNINVSRSTVYQYMDGQIEPKPAIKLKILELYPEVNANWLLFGRGTMKETDTLGVGEMSPDELIDRLQEKESPVFKILQMAFETPDRNVRELIESYKMTIQALKSENETLKNQLSVK